MYEQVVVSLFEDIWTSQSSGYGLQEKRYLKGVM